MNITNLSKRDEEGNVLFKDFNLVVNQGDKIVFDGVQKVKDDEKIKFSFIAPKDALSQLQLKAE